MSNKHSHETLAALGLDPLLDSATVCAAEGISARETLSRRVSRGDFPPPDRIISGRNFWYRSTYLEFARAAAATAD